MKFISEKYVPADWIALAEENGGTINVRLCRDCEYFKQEHPTIDTDGDLGYCSYKTNFIILDDEPINWYFTTKKSFCDESTIGDEDAY